MPEDLSLYIHFPFCIRKCNYCDFASEDVYLNRIDSWTEALIAEIDLRKKMLTDSKIYTIYFGGGSPNLIGTNNFRKIVKALRQYPTFDTIKEFTVEINPGTIDENFLYSLNMNGVNRISVGAQSFDNNELKILGRIHNSESIDSTVQIIKKIGFPHISLDLIFGIPGQNMRTWDITLEKTINSKIDHISAYNLIYESGTVLTNLKKEKKIFPLSDDLEWEMYEYVHKKLENEGYVHYEISNWSKAGCLSFHNMAYWNGKKYLGFGPAAHSFDGNHRWWNYRNIDSYIKFLNNSELAVENFEKLSRDDILLEFLLLGLRTGKGINIDKFENITRLNFLEVYDIFLSQTFSGFDKEYGFIDNNHFKLSPKGWFICNSVNEKFLSIIERRMK